MAETYEPVLEHEGHKVQCHIELQNVGSAGSVTVFTFKVRPYFVRAYDTTCIKEEVWRRLAEYHLCAFAAKLAGLPRKDFFETGWELDQTVRVSTVKEPTKDLSALKTEMPLVAGKHYRRNTDEVTAINPVNQLRIITG